MVVERIIMLLFLRTHPAILNNLYLEVDGDDILYLISFILIMENLMMTIIFIYMCLGGSKCAGGG